MLGEPEYLTAKTFRLGLFGLDKIQDVDATVAACAKALDSVGLTPVEGNNTLLPDPTFGERILG